MIGTTLGHYRIVSKLGQGGMGEVFEAEDERLKRRVALKLLSPGVAAGEEQRERFQREAETIASLNHPNIVTLYSVEQEDGRQFLTMEKVEGEGLDRVIGRGGLPLERIFEIAIPMADALSAAHARDVVHRDLKPANVMITGEGRVKILDFGLAKLVDEPTGAVDEATAVLTQEGMVLGTVPYMSPEQVQGKPVDRRTDVFSLGVILYEMATGSRPFGGDNSAELISSILRDQPPAVTEIDSRLPHHLGRIVRHCLEKDPGRRYQSALDVRNELEALKKEVDSGIVHTETLPIPATTPGRRRWPLWAGLGAAIVVIAVAAWSLLGPSPATPPAAPTTAGVEFPDQSSIAVLFFDNLSGDPELDWLRNGLTDMLVTDLSQSPEVRVLSTDRVYQILADMQKLDERITSFEVVREVATRGDAETVILGSYAKLGDTIQISIKIQEAATGEILKAASVRAQGQEEIFARVDDLSRNIRRSIELPEEPVAIADRSVAEVTTSSVEAYRYFAEAERLHLQIKDQEAIELYKKAVEIDPEFALAWAKLGTAHGNLGMVDEERGYLEKAIEHVERLTVPERAYVEGRYYGKSLPTMGRAIEIYRSTLDRYPHLTALANNVGILYRGLWMYEEAIAAFEQSIAYGDVFPGTYNSLADCYFATGQTDRAIEVLETFVAENPQSFSTYASLAQVYGYLGDTEASMAALDRADELRPGYFVTIVGRFAYAVASEDWEQARSQVENLAKLPFPFAQSVSLGFETVLLLYEGRSADAMAAGERSVAAWQSPGPSRAQSKLGVGAGYLALHQPAKALEYLTGAREDDPDQAPDLIGHGLQTLAFELLGESQRADAVLAEYENRAESVPGRVFPATTHEIRGNLALIRGDVSTAIAELERASAFHPWADASSLRLWDRLAEAYLQAGQDTDAEQLLEKMLAHGPGRIFSPPQYILSHYRLGKLREKRGDDQRARELYQKFVEYWQDGDMEREAIADAQRFLSAGSSG